MLNKSSYSDGIKGRLAEFEELTGIQVAFAMHPEETYPARLASAFAVPFAQPDVYVTRANQLSRPGERGRMLPLDDFVKAPSLTRQNYILDDFQTEIIDAFRFPFGLGPLLAVPVGMEGDASPDQIWGLAVNPLSENRTAAWLFVQYFTSQDFQSSPERAGDALRSPRREAGRIPQ
jgi:maltose-binding protein MalE